MNIQDWEKIILNKPKKKERNPQKEVSKQVELDYNDDPDAPKVVSKSVGQHIASARIAKQMSQSALAKACSIPAKTIQEYESGKGIPDSKVLQKLREVLKVKLNVK